MYLRGISRYLVWRYQNKRSLLSDELLEVVGNNEEAYLEHNEAGVGSLKKDAVLQFMRENTTPVMEESLVNLFTILCGQVYFIYNVDMGAL
ncbi:hypothetical protein GQ600_8216 [Phytophthora cactorum]|nr:hypothetical protein GQ600_8216 [Phytophthora cactorum]